MNANTQDKTKLVNAYVDLLFSASNKSFEPMAALRRLCASKTANALSSEKITKHTERLIMGMQGIGLPAPPPLENLKLPPSPGSLVDEELQLASFPDIYFQIMNVLNNPQSSAQHVADVVSKDTSLSAKLLRLVNSPLYGFPSEVDTITRAVTLVGSDELSLLALGVSVVQYFQEIPHDLVDMKLFWQHAIACGVYAKILASEKGEKSSERYFLGGLLHDIGWLVIVKNYPQLAVLTHIIERKTACSPKDAEEKVLGFNHAIVAGHLLEAWKFPAGLKDMIHHHHAPEMAENTQDASIIHVADILARTLQNDNVDPSFMPQMDQEAWNTLGLPLFVLEIAATQADKMVNDIFQAFLGTDDD